MKDQNLSLMQFLKKMAVEAGLDQKLQDMNDDVLIYQLKMRGLDHSAMIPGIAKDCEEDFKTAMLRARGVISD